jgi:hypothetical protein
MRREGPGVDPPAAAERPERQSEAGRERTADERVEPVEREDGGVEREAPVDAGDGAGVESPPRDADRAGLLP